MSIGKAILIYCIVAIAFIIVWGRGSIAAWVDLLFIGLSVVSSSTV